MKKKFRSVSDCVRLIGIARMKGSEEIIDFYFVHPKYGRVYAFTRKYTKGAYELVKCGIPVKNLLCVRSRDTMIMRLVKYLSNSMLYFMDEIEWMVAA